MVFFFRYLMADSPFPFFLHGEYPWREIAAEMDPDLTIHGLGVQDVELSEYGDEEAEQKAGLHHVLFTLQRREEVRNVLSCENLDE